MGVNGRETAPDSQAVAAQQAATGVNVVQFRENSGACSLVRLGM